MNLRSLSPEIQPNGQIGGMSSKDAAFMRLLIDAVEDYAIFALDPQGNILTWNRGAARLKGYKAQEIIGSHFSRFYLATDIARQHPQRELEIATRVGRYEEEVWRIRKDGTQFWANVVITRLNDPQGRLVGFTKVTRDLTERRAAEQKLRESEERLRLLVSSVQDYAIINLNPSGLVTTWNTGAERITGYSEAEIIGQHFSKFYPQDQAQKAEVELKATDVAGRFEDEGWYMRKDGSLFWANVIIGAIRDPEKNLLGFSVVTRDLTERKRNEEILKNAYDSLEIRVRERTAELAEAVRAREEFLSLASHELNTPLCTLKLKFQMRKRQITKDPSKKFTGSEFTEIANEDEKQVDRLIQLVKNMLDISRLTSRKLTLALALTDLNEVINDVIDNLAPHLGGSSRKILFKRTDPVVGLWDRNRLEQVFTNLLTNALKYGGDQAIEVEAEVAGSQARFSVRDFGIGIAAEDHARMFQPFERGVSPSQISGLGLGLYVTKQIVEAHGGSIMVESEIGRGSNFVVYVPMKTTASPHESTRS